NIARQKTK
ncbi:hypothetical protein CFC21_022489, partial [Triticum aestivum]